MRFEHTKVSWHFIAGFDQYDVTRDELIPFDSLTYPSPDHIGMGRKHMTNGVHRPFCLSFLQKANERIGDNHRQNHPGVDPVFKCGSHDCRP